MGLNRANLSFYEPAGQRSMHVSGAGETTKNDWLILVYVYIVAG